MSNRLCQIAATLRLLLLLLLLPTLPLNAGTRTGALAGIVVDEVGNGLPRTAVFLLDSREGRVLESALTDAVGGFLFPEILPNSYLIRAERRGFLPTLSPLMAVRSGKTAATPIILRGGAVSPSVVLPLPQTARAVPPPLEPLVSPVPRTEAAALRPPAEAEKSEGVGLPQVLAATIQDALKEVSVRAAGGAASAEGEEKLPPGAPASGSRAQAILSESEVQWLAWGDGPAGAGSSISALVGGNASPDNPGWSARVSGGRAAGVLFFSGWVSERFSPRHEVVLGWHFGSLPEEGEPSAEAGAAAGLLYPGEGEETILSGAGIWEALDPLHVRCDVEYRVSGGEEKTRVARPSVALEYRPFQRTSLSSHVGMAMRSPDAQEVDDPRDAQSAVPEATTAADLPASPRSGRMEYGLALEQGFGRGYSVSLDAGVRNLLPGLASRFNPAAPFAEGPESHLYVAENGLARARGMSLSVSKSFGRLLAGSLGTSYLEGQGDVVALPVLPGTSALTEGMGDGRRFRCISSRLDTLLPGVGTDILLACNWISNLADGLLPSEGGSAAEFWRVDLGLRQELPFIAFAGTDWELLMAVSGLGLREGPSDELAKPARGLTSGLGRVAGGLKVSF